MSSLRLLISAGVLLVLSGALSAQQLSLFTQYRESAPLINPAAMEVDYLNFGYNITVGLNYRKQWTGISGSPETQSARFSYVSPESGLVAGGFVINDQTGPTGFTGAYGRIGYTIDLGGDRVDQGLTIAVHGGYVGYQVRGSEIRLRDRGDVIGTMNQGQGHPDVGAGIYYYNLNRNNGMFYAGLSAPQVLGFNLLFQNDEGEFEVERVRHYYAMTGYHFLFDNDGILELSAWGKYVEGAPFNADFNLRYQTPSALYLGAGAATSGNAHVEAGVTLGDNVGLENIIRIGYALDYSFSSFGPSVGATHEIQASFSLEH